MCQFQTYVFSLPGRVPAVLYSPELLTEKSKTGIVLMHSDDNYLDFVPAPELAKRGYRVLAANIPDPKAPLDGKVIHVKAAVDYLKTYPGIEKVVLLGHSGGATLMSAYQAIAENGTAVFQDEKKIIKCETPDILTPADGVMLLDSNFGNGCMTLFSLDPAVVEEFNGMKRDPELDLFAPENGFDPDGSHYSDEFKEKFYRTQGARGNALIAYAQDRVRAVAAGEGHYKDDEPLVIPSGLQYAPFNKMFPQDLSLLAHTKKEYPLIHADGSIDIEIVPSVRIARPGGMNTDSMKDGALMTTVKTYLSSQAVRVNEDFHVGEDGVYGIDWDSTYCCTPSNVPYISVPMLIMGMTGSYEYLASEVIYERAGSKEKTICFVEGASHNFTPAYEAEKYQGQFGDTVKHCFDYVDSWIDQMGRFY